MHSGGAVNPEPPALKRRTLGWRRLIAPVAALLMLTGCSSQLSDEQLLPFFLDVEWSYVTDMYPDAQRPVVEVVRHVGAEEWSAVHVTCLADAGIEGVKLSENGDVEFPELTNEAFELARYTCFAAYPPSIEEMRVVHSELSQLQ